MSEKDLKISHILNYNHNINEILELDDNQRLIIAGPCAVENYSTLKEIAVKLKLLGVNYLRAGAFKPRTSPYDFQGLGFEGLEILKQIKNDVGIKIVTEIPSPKYIKEFNENVDIIQVGARNMQNFDLLNALSKLRKPILLKRGFGNTLAEWLYAAEYILKGGNQNVILCERGIKTFENATRNTLDLSSVAIIKNLSKILVIVDPSHASGRSDIIPALSKASIAVGADGLLIEVHSSPNHSISDREQTITIESFSNIINEIKKV